MKDLEQLEKIIEARLDEIRNKDDKTLNERQEYSDKQELLRQIGKVEYYIREYVKDNE